MWLELDPKLTGASFDTALASGRLAEAREAYAAFFRLAPPEARGKIEPAMHRLQK